jgi:DnaJ-class molecular chaperone
MSTKYEKEVICDRCFGKGWLHNIPEPPLLGPLSIVCPKCNGKKKIVNKSSNRTDAG